MYLPFKSLPLYVLIFKQKQLRQRLLQGSIPDDALSHSYEESLDDPSFQVPPNAVKTHYPKLVYICLQPWTFFCNSSHWFCTRFSQLWTFPETQTLYFSLCYRSPFEYLHVQCTHQPHRPGVTLKAEKAIAYSPWLALVPPFTIYKATQ